MKKIIVGLVLAVSVTSSMACCYRHGGLLGPLVGGIIGYEIGRSQDRERTVIVQQPVYVQQPQVVSDPNLVVINGVLYRKQHMIVNGVMQEVLTPAQ